VNHFFCLLADHPAGFMIADAVRYMSVHSWKQPDLPWTQLDDTAAKATARDPGNTQVAGRFRWWWQVMGSNHRRLSRRFYREPIPTHRNGR